VPPTPKGVGGRLRPVLGLIRSPAELEGRFSLRRFAQSAGVLSLKSVTDFARAVIAAKLFAVTLGPTLVGVQAQLFNFQALVGAVLPLGLSTGVSKMIAEDTRDVPRVSSVVLTSSAIALAAGLAAALVLTPVVPQLSSALTGSSHYELPVLLLVWSFPLYNLGSVVYYQLQGLAAVKRLTRAGILTTIFAVAALIPLTVAYGLTGTMVSVLVTSVAQAIFFSFELWREYAARGWRFAGAAFNRPIARQLLGFGWILLIGAVFTWASVVVVRTLTLHTLGQHANGLYQVVFGLSGQFAAVFLAWMGAYVFPRLVAEAGSPRLGSLLNSGLRANLAIMVPFFVVAIALRDPLIRIFYSSAFVAAAPLIPIQVFGDYLRVIGWSFAVCLFAVGRTSSHLAVIAGQAVLWVVLAFLMVPIWGLNAVPIAYTVSYLTYPVLGLALVRRWTGTGPDRRAWMLMALAAVCVAGAAAPFYTGILLAPVMPVLVYVLNRRELRQAAA